MTSSTEADQDAAYSEDEAVFEWRVEQFADLTGLSGEHLFSRSEATRLVLGGADYHQAEKLARAGCPRSTITRIL